MLRDDINAELKIAMKAKNPRAVSTLRLILAAIKDRDIAARGDGNSEGIDDRGVTDLLQKMIRQRRESIDLYEKASRPEMAQQEGEEIAIIERFLPQQMSDAEILAAVDAMIAALEAKTVKDMGRVMAELKARYSGQMDFSQVASLIKQRLS